MTFGKLDKGFCKGCSQDRYIVNKGKRLCAICNNIRLFLAKPPKSFRKNRNAARNQKYYKEMWNTKPRTCEECGIELKEYSASYISHIISKGANSFLRSESDNCRIYCLEHHQQWETGNKKLMKTYQENEEIREKLTLKYYTNGRT